MTLTALFPLNTTNRLTSLTLALPVGMSEQGPTSPKKKLSCGLNTMDKSQLSAVPDFSGVPTEIVFDSDDDEEVVEVDDFEDTEFDSSSSSEEYVEEVVEYGNSDEESESETETTSDLQNEINNLTSEIKPTVRRGRSFKSDDDFEALPPPIEIPNALRPPHLRTPDSEKPIFKMHDTFSSDSSSDDDDSSDDNSSFNPPKSPALRPSVVVETKDANGTQNKNTVESSSEDSEDESVQNRASSPSLRRILSSNEPVNKASLSLGKAGYLKTTGIVFFSCCISV